MSSGSEASSRAKCAHKTSWLNTSKFYGLIGIRGPLLPGREVLACGIAFELERKRRRAKHVSQHARLPCPKVMSAHSGNRACCPSVVIDDGSTGLQPPPLPLRF